MCAPTADNRPGALVRRRQAQKRNRPSPNFLPAQAPSGAGRNGTQALLILCAGRILPTSRGNPRKWGPGPTPPVRGRCRVATEGIGWATMSTKCSSGAVPGGVLGNLSRTSRRSPTKWVRREEEEQGNERSFRHQAETESSGLCDDEPPRAKSLAARRRRNLPARNETALSSPPHPSGLTASHLPP